MEFNYQTGEINNQTLVKNNLAASVPPTVNDDSGSGYTVGSNWTDTVGGKAYICFDSTPGAAVWTEITGGAGSPTSGGYWDQITGDVGVILATSTSQHLTFTSADNKATITVADGGTTDTISLQINQANLTITESQISDLGSYLTDITGQSINNLSDVSSSMVPTEGQVLTYNATNGWQAETAGGGATGYLYSGTITTPPAGTGEDSLVIGDGANGNSGQGKVTIGKDAGNTTSNANDGAIVIGWNAGQGPTTQLANRSIWIGYGAKASGNVPSNEVTIIGYSAKNYGKRATSIGSMAAAHTYGTALGYNSLANTQSYATAVGSQSNASGQYAVCVGNLAVAQGTGAIAIGASYVQAKYDYSIALGFQALANHRGAVCIGRGIRSHNENEFNWGPALTDSGIPYSGTEIPRNRKLILTKYTTNATPVEMEIGNGSYLAYENYSNWMGTIKVFAAERYNSANAAAYEFDFAWRIIGTAGSGTFLYNNKTVLGEDNVNFDVSLDNDTTNGRWKLMVTGLDATNVIWMAYFDGIYSGNQ